MGEFVKMTALRNVSAATVADAVVHFANDNGISAEVIGTGGGSSHIFSAVYPQVGSWSVISWPREIFFALKASRWISENLDTVASVIDIYDSDSWSHVAYVSGHDGARYTSDPAGQTSDATSLQEAESRWRGDPQATAEIFGVDIASIAAYMQPPNSSALRGGGRVFPEDDASIGDPWVVVDFWRRLGIPFPRGSSFGDGGSLFVQFPDLRYPPPVYDTSED